MFNIQVVCDCQKRILYRSIRSQGAEHESTSFKDCSCYKYLLDKWMNYLERWFYLIGDSVYALQSFLIIPFDNVMHGTPKDDFTICICHQEFAWSVHLEKLTWGGEFYGNVFVFLWKITYDEVIDACLRLLNFIVDYRKDR